MGLPRRPCPHGELGSPTQPQPDQALNIPHCTRPHPQSNEDGHHVSRRWRPLNQTDQRARSLPPRTSAKLLGTIVTNDQQTRDNFFMERVERIKSTLPKVSLLSHQAHLHLLRQSISSKPLHILATTFISEEALISADTTITSHLSNLFNIPDSQQFLIHLPIKEGGLGIPHSFRQPFHHSSVHTHRSTQRCRPITSRAKVDLESRDTQPSFSTSKPVMRMITHLTKEEYDAARQGQKQLRAHDEGGNSSEAVIAVRPPTEQAQCDQVS
ncbi:hypothetical protein BLNAU_13365 [Blattamonas nauphoetae]|uniref:Uncharacterized protein n=1 Tax=Blattamonas nauphoetae TaxID=2049346 RepID=A0ABQ9XK81_9EUKA|nr:hypothetical protein BLNAU_13365 [Blattamonas nauphoetae]